MQNRHYPTIIVFFLPLNILGSVFVVSSLVQHTRQGRRLSHTRWVLMVCITQKRWLLFLCQCKLLVLTPGDQSHSIHTPPFSLLPSPASCSSCEYRRTKTTELTEPPLIKYLGIAKPSPCIVLFKPMRQTNTIVLNEQCGEVSAWLLTHSSYTEKLKFESVPSEPVSWAISPISKNKAMQYI